MSLPPSIQKRLTLPAMVAPMFLCSGVDLVAESCKAGLIATLTRNHCRTDAEFEAQITTVRERLADFAEAHPNRRIGPLAANISLRMDRDSLRNSLDICRKHRVEIVVTTAADPAPFVDFVHDWGALLYHDVTTMRFAEKAIVAGVDGIIAIGTGGGGHSGNISHLSFIPHIRSIFSGTIIAAGAIGNGSAIRAMELLGADLSYIGTRFIATQESSAPDAYKALLVSQTVADLVYTGLVNKVPAMWMLESLRQSGVEVEQLLSGERPPAEAIPPTVKPWRDLWSAGQSIGLIEDIPTVADLVVRLRDEYRRAAQMPCAYPVDSP
jgi:nitronate monooxygenase